MIIKYMRNKNSKKQCLHKLLVKILSIKVCEILKD